MKNLVLALALLCLVGCKSDDKKAVDSSTVKAGAPVEVAVSDKKLGDSLTVTSTGTWSLAPSSGSVSNLAFSGAATGSIAFGKFPFSPLATTTTGTWTATADNSTQTTLLYLSGGGTGGQIAFNVNNLNPVPQGGGWDTLWTTKTPVIIPIQFARADVTNYSYLIPAPAGYTGNGSDLAFETQDGTRLPCEIVSSGTSSTPANTSEIGQIWVKIPLLPGSTGTNAVQYVWELSGNPLQTFAQANSFSTQVWADYAAVWHYAPSALVDSTSNGHNNINPFNYAPLTPSSSAGPLGMAAQQGAGGAGGGGPNYVISTSATSNLSLVLGGTFTIESLIYMTTYPGGLTTTGSGNAVFLGSEYWTPGETSPDELDWTFGCHCITSNTCALCLQTNGNIDNWSYTTPMGTCGSTNITLGAWHYCVCTYCGSSTYNSGTGPVYYIDGVNVGSQSAGPIPPTGVSPGYSNPAQYNTGVQFGWAYMHGAQNPVNGYLGETRVTNGVARSASYVASTYNQIFAPPTPATPTGLATIGTGPNTTTVTWNPSSGATSYYLTRGTSSGGPFTLVFSGNALKYCDTGLLPNTTYYYEVEAANDAGPSAYSSPLAGATQTIPSWAMGWTSFTRVVIPVQAGQQNVTNFPLLLKSVPNYSGNGNDLAFATDSGGSISTQLSCEVVSSSQNTAYSTPPGEVWIQVPLLPGSLGTNAAQAYWVLSGNTAQTVQPSGMAAQVWDSNYAAVWHFGQSKLTGSTTGDKLTDSSSNANNIPVFLGDLLGDPGQNYQALVGGTSGFSGGPLGLAGAQVPVEGGPPPPPYLMVSSSASSLNLTHPFTIESLFYLNAYPGASHGDSGGTLGAANWFVAQETSVPTNKFAWAWGLYCPGASPSNTYLCLQMNGNIQPTTTAAMGSCGTHNVVPDYVFSPVTWAGWHYCVVTYNGTDPTYYLDGVADTAQHVGAVYGYSDPAVSNIGTTIGYSGNVARPNTLRGAVSETRISKGIARSASYIAATYSEIFKVSPPANAWSAAWPTRQRVVIPVQVGQQDVTNFPLLVHVPAGYSGDGSDLAFATDSGGVLSTRLPCEVVVSINSPTGEIWIQVPLLPGSLGTNAPQAYWVLSGNAAQTSQPIGMAAQVWDSGYAAVWHMGIVPSTDGQDFNPYLLADSTSNANFCPSGNVQPFTTANNVCLDHDYVPVVQGPLGMAATQQPAAVDDLAAYRIGCGSSSSLSLSHPFTIESLVYLTDFPGGSQTDGSPGAAIWAASQSTWSVWSPNGQDQRAWDFGVYCPSSVGAYLCLQTNGNIQPYTTTSAMGLCGTTSITPGFWQYWVVTYDGTTPTYYLDGIHDGTQITGPITGYQDPGNYHLETTFGWGNYHDYPNSIAGYVGETRISNGVIRSPAYIAATYKQIFPTGNEKLLKKKMEQRKLLLLLKSKELKGHERP